MSYNIIILFICLTNLYIFILFNFILSRKYFLYTPGKNIIKEYQPRMELNDKKIKYVIREKNKIRSSTEIAWEIKI